MFAWNCRIIFAVIGLWLCSIISNASGACDRKLCPGPLYYYEELGCSPVFENATSCCPTRYNCDVWDNLPADKCFVNGRYYEDDEVILPTGFASDPCLHCRCYGRKVLCSIPSCVSPRHPEPGCYHHFSSLECCHNYQICENSPVACIVDGKSYKIGETFHPVAEPEKTCYCKKGYNGTNDEQFCVWKKPSWCGNVIMYVADIRGNFPPYYAKDAALYKDCNKGHINSQTWTYELEKKPSNGGRPGTVEAKVPVNQCKFENSTMDIGDKLHANHAWGDIVSCVCEVPPIPTCYKIEPSEDVTTEVNSSEGLE